MGTKNISIMDDVYDSLVRRKSEEESFSDVIRRSLRKKSLLDFAGALSDMSDENYDNLNNNIKKMRKIGIDSFKKRIERIKNEMS